MGFMKICEFLHPQTELGGPVKVAKPFLQLLEVIGFDIDNLALMDHFQGMLIFVFELLFFYDINALNILEFIYRYFEAFLFFFADVIIINILGFDFIILFFVFIFDDNS